MLSRLRTARLYLEPLGIDDLEPVHAVWCEAGVRRYLWDDQLIDRAVAFAGGLTAVPAYALRQSRRLLDTINMRDQLQLEAVAIRTAARGEVFRAALKAFLEAHQH